MTVEHLDTLVGPEKLKSDQLFEVIYEGIKSLTYSNIYFKGSYGFLNYVLITLLIDHSILNHPNTNNMYRIRIEHFISSQNKRHIKRFDFDDSPLHIKEMKKYCEHCSSYSEGEGWEV